MSRLPDAQMGNYFGLNAESFSIIPLVKIFASPNLESPSFLKRGTDENFLIPFQIYDCQETLTNQKNFPLIPLPH
jgi:hypothetical protein